MLEGYDEEITRAFLSLLNDAAGAFGYAIIGIALIRDRFTEAMTLHPPGPHNRTFLGEGSATGSGPDAYQAWPSLSVADQLADRGPVKRQIGHQWLSFVHDEWNEYYRKELAKAAGIKPKEIELPIMGDVRHMRNDIIHHRAVATRHNSGKCTVLRWFRKDDELFITLTMVREFMDHFGLSYPA